MAPKNIYDSKHWRDRAAEMRALADNMSNSKPAQLLNDLADDYDRLLIERKSDAKETVPGMNRKVLIRFAVFRGPWPILERSFGASDCQPS